MYHDSVGSACLDDLLELDFGADEIFGPLREDAGVVFGDVLSQSLEWDSMEI